MRDFVHLHVHTQASILQSSIRCEELKSFAEGYGMKAVGVADIGNMYDAINFYKTFSSSAIKPILGCHFFIVDTIEDRSRRLPAFSICLLAKNLLGYKNLCYLNTYSHLKSDQKFGPFIDKKVLRENCEGLIALSCGSEGEIYYQFSKNNIEEGKKALEYYKGIFGEDFYLEIHRHGVEDEGTNKALVELSASSSIPLLASSRIFYLKKEDKMIQKILLSIKSKQSILDTDFGDFDKGDYYFRSPEEMEELFSDLPEEALSNSVKIAEECNVEIDFKTRHYPIFPISNGHESEESYLKDLCYKALEGRYKFDEQDCFTYPEYKMLLKSNPQIAEKFIFSKKSILDRIEEEVSIISGKNFCSYFLIVRDFIHYAKREGIPIGKGRGSGAGSLVAYLLNITDVDPIRYGLVFERFLNPERNSPPDFDIDICERRRDEIIDYVKKKYGETFVSQIITMGNLKAKQAIKDSCKSLGYNHEVADKINKKFRGERIQTVLDNPKGEDVEFVNMQRSDERVGEIVSNALLIEGLHRNVGIHASGFIIGDQDLSDFIPLTKGKEGEIVSQYQGKNLEDLGLLKMDFLGLKTLTTIDLCVKYVEEKKGKKINLDTISYSRKEVFDLIARGETIGLFQIESEGMKKYCIKMKVSSLDELSILLAMYRPGPMQYIDELIERKKSLQMGKRLTKSWFYSDELKPILLETYGFMVYQEQVMKIAQTFAGYSMGLADEFRRAIGKKDVKAMSEQEQIFYQKAKECGRDDDLIKKIYSDIEKFANYGFNKSHSVSYAYLAYQTAFLKCLYPLEFILSLLNTSNFNTDKFKEFLREAKRLNIKIFSPDINLSGEYFTIEGKGIRYGLGAIKGVGEILAKKIVNARKENQSFKGFENFCLLVPDINKRALEILIYSGAFSCFSFSKSSLIEIYEDILSSCQAESKERNIGQGILFQDEEVSIKEIEEYSNELLGEKEFEFLYAYCNHHPLTPYGHIGKQVNSHDNLQGLFASKGNKVEFFLLVYKNGSERVYNNKEGVPEQVVLFFEDESLFTRATMSIDKFLIYKKTFEENSHFFIQGYFNKGIQRLFLEKIVKMEEYFVKFKKVEIHLNAEEYSRDDFFDLKELLYSYPLNNFYRLEILNVSSRFLSRYPYEDKVKLIEYLSNELSNCHSISEVKRFFSSKNFGRIYEKEYFSSLEQERLSSSLEYFLNNSLGTKFFFHYKKSEDNLAVIELPRNFFYGQKLDEVINNCFFAEKKIS